MRFLPRILCFLLALACLPTVTRAAAFERVVSSGVLRCGYQYWDGGILKDEATGKLRGFMVEYTEQLAKNADLRVEWVGPTDWANMAAELNSNKIDAWCAGTWLSGKNAKFMLVSDPVVYNGFEAFVRADDMRFDADPALLNDPSVRLAIMGNTSSAYIAQRILPRAAIVDLPPTVTDVEVIMNVAMNKADVGFNNPGIVYQYMKNNPGAVKRLRPGQPYAMMGVTFTTRGDDFRLLHLLNTGVRELENTNYTAGLVEAYNKQYPGLFVQEEGE